MYNVLNRYMVLKKADQFCFVCEKAAFNNNTFFLFFLFVPHLTNAHRTHHCTYLTRAIMHVASLEAHATLNTYNLWKLALRGHFDTDARTRYRTWNF